MDNKNKQEGLLLNVCLESHLVEVLLNSSWIDDDAFICVIVIGVYKEIETIQRRS